MIVLQQIKKQGNQNQNLDQISPWTNQIKTIVFNVTQNNTNSQEDKKLFKQLDKQSLIHQKRKSISVPKINSLSALPKKQVYQFETIPRVYKIFQSKIREDINNIKHQAINRKNSQCYLKDIKSHPIAYHQFKINENKEYSPRQLKNNGKMTNPQRFYSRKQPLKYKQDLNQILRKTLKTPAVCNRIKNIVKQNIANNYQSQRKYSIPMRFSSKQYVKYHYYQRSRSELRNTQILFKPKITLAEQHPVIKQNKKKFMIRLQKKHILDKVLEKYHD